ncbi:acyl-CoA dehydrogenase family protein [Peterkaempfera bronchialis]|uniref:acyl-CoA dehydrogenase family protein n=1 Tax=Peterkaempfera bronchialis TaxID=2126346 RepID=UPI00187E739B|nr:acyl-CoA dehydrogenase family protein [Peterkaempfera bronchialis]
MAVADEEREDLRRTVRDFLDRVSPSDQVRRAMETERGWDPQVWRRLAEELGLAGLLVPEKHGGAGAGAPELAVVMAEMGRSLLCAPFLSTAVLSVAALTGSDDETACADLLPAIAEGRTIAALAFAEGEAPRDLAAITTTARPDGDGGHVLHGVKDWVVDGAAADLLLVAARTGSGLSLFAVDSAAAGETVTARRLDALDLTRALAQVTLDGAPARLIGREGGAEEALRGALDLATVALAAEQSGGLRKCLDTAVEYAQTRVQFGRPIGSFQAIKHKCAQLLLEAESADAAVEEAAEHPGEPIGVSAAAAYCAEAYVRASAENLQIHGGIGFTWEHDAHLHLRRARSSSLLLGSASWHLERISDHLGLVPEAV